MARMINKWMLHVILALVFVSVAQSGELFFTYYNTWCMAYDNQWSLSQPYFISTKTYASQIGNTTHVIVFMGHEIVNQAHPPYLSITKDYADAGGGSADSLDFLWSASGNPGAGYSDWVARGGIEALRDSLHAKGKYILVDLQAVDASVGLNYVMADSARTEVFTKAVAGYCNTHNFDGADLNVEINQTYTNAQLVRFFRILRRNMPSPKLITAVPPPSDFNDYAPAMQYIDYILPQFYNWPFTVAWNSNVGANQIFLKAPLHKNPLPSGSELQDFTTYGPDNWYNAGWPKSKIVILMSNEANPASGSDQMFATAPGAYFWADTLAYWYLTHGGTYTWDDTHVGGYVHGTATGTQGMNGFTVSSGQKFYIAVLSDRNLDSVVAWGRSKGYSNYGLYDVSTDARTPAAIKTPRHAHLSSILNATPPPPVPTGSFSASPTSLPSGGGTSTLTWTSANATSASIDQGVGTVQLNGSTTVTVTSTKTFTLTLTNANGARTYTATVTVATPPAPPSAPALATPANNAVNQATTLSLSWNASTGATSYRLQLSSDSLFATTVVNDSTITGTSRQVGPLSNATKYFWRVNAKNAGGTSAYSSTRNFTTVPSVPAAPTLAAPTSGATGQPTTVNLGWNSSTGATSYRVQLSTDSLFASTVVNDSTVTGTSRQVGPLSNATRYFWRINAKNSGGTSAYSAIWSFTTIIAIPSTPTLTSPANGAVNQSLTLNLGWNAPTGATSCRLQLSTDSLFASTIVDDSTVTGTFRQVGPLSSATKYFWRMNAKNAAGTSSYSAVWKFTTVPAAPAIPTLASPASGTTGQATTLSLSWSASTGATTYRVQLSTDSLFASTVVNDSTLTGTSRQVGPLSNATKYFWRVNAKNSGGTSAYSPVWNFSTIVAPPATPTLAAPADGATNQATTLNLSWNASAGSTSYRLQLSADSLFASTVVDDSGITGTSRQVGPLSNATKYFWRVNARNSGGTSAFSAVRSFATVPAVPAAPTLAAPSDGAANQSTSLNLSWNASAGAASYRVQVSTDSLFASTVVNDSTLTGTSRQIGPLADATKYYWRVNAKNAGGTSAYSSAWSFITNAAIPAAPALSSPANSATNQAVTLTLSWNAVTTATSYGLQLSTDSLFASTIVNDSTITGTSKQVGPLTNATKYFWRVNAKNGTSSGAYSAVRNFTTIIAAPVAPTLAAPGDGSTNQTTTLSLSWNASQGATSYRFQLSTDSLFGTTVVNDSTVTGSTRQVGPLANATKYFWRLNAKNTGGTSVYSSVWSFTTIIAASPAPVLAAPANGSTGLSTTLTLSWSPSAGATSYRLQLSADSLFVSMVVNDSTITGTSRQVGPLSIATKYFWRVQARNAGGNSGYSSVWTFMTNVAPPGTPVLASPASSSINLPTTLTLGWMAVAGATNYRLQVSADSAFGATMLDDSTITGTSRQVAGLAYGTKYFWRVRAANNGGASGYSSVWSFVTTVPLPLVPVLVSPGNGSSGQPTTLALTWNASTGATSYRLQLSADSSFGTSLVNDSSITGTSRQVSGLANGTKYYWRVRATNSGGSSANSSVWNFTTVVIPPVTPILASPASGSTNLPTTLVLSWNASAGALKYRLQVSTDASFSTIVFDDSTLVGTSYQLSGLSAGVNYSWRLRASNTAGSSAYSQTWSFSTGVGLPGVPTLMSPALGSTKQPTVVTFSWNSVQGAAKYHVQVSADSLFRNQDLDDSTVVTTSRTDSSLSKKTTYYWRVRAKNGVGNGAFSQPWNLTTSVGSPGPPKLRHPGKGSNNPAAPLTIGWDSTADATMYRAQIATDSLFTAIVLDYTAILGTSAQATLPASKYYWHVQAVNEDGASPWSEWWDFSVTPLAMPTGSFSATPNILPAGGGIVTLTWQSTNAQSASIDRNIGSVPTNGMLNVRVDTTCNFVLTLTNSVWSQTYLASVFVQPAQSKGILDVTSQGTPTVIAAEGRRQK